MIEVVKAENQKSPCDLKELKWLTEDCMLMRHGEISKGFIWGRGKNSVPERLITGGRVKANV